MKTLVLSSTLAAALAGMPVHAADAPAPRPVAKPSAVMDAMLSTMRELQAADKSKLPMRERLDALAEFHHTPETAQKLKTVFGSERPWTLARLPVSNGRYDYVGTLAPLHYTSEAGENYEWAPLTLKVSLDKASRNMTTNGSWPSLVFDDKNVHVAVRDISLSAKQKRGFGDLWFGASQASIASVQFDVKKDGTKVALEDIRFHGNLVERPKAADLAYGFSIKSITALGEKVDNVKFAMRMTNIDKATMAELKVLGEKANSNAPGSTPEQQLAAMQPVFKSLGKAVIQRGAAWEIDEISAGYKGNTASLKGRVTVEGASDADLANMPALVKKIVARFNIRVPVALVRDITTNVATRQVSAQAKGGPANPQTVAQIAQSMHDIIIGKMVGGGYARIEKDVLVSDIEFRGGVLRINGKEIALPAFNAPRTPPLQARRIESRCVLPDYPESVVRGEQPFELSISFVVKADGTVADVGIVKPSQIPAYDQALLAAMEHCAYMPALIDGKPVQMPTTWHIVSEPGQARP
ncbi:DUF945 family protein [Massilia sp. R2A-15]|uniref:DUF945 family protein n=1 Tax=Massilia sp. R2A-15 TaxID=3064278 RepID=UPI002735A4AB|nr:DUF945 family protein [Massilia sp. R2A-15]WLI89869.1 DUF945 family protein [Massilia sp. R2A-15]